MEPDRPLIWNNNGQAVKVYRIAGTPSGSGKFDLKDWSVLLAVAGNIGTLKGE